MTYIKNNIINNYIFYEKIYIISTNNCNYNKVI